MAVFTHVDAEDIDALLTRYGVGPLLSVKGIAEGVENSNYLVDAAGGRFILTLYEKRVETAHLPFYIGLIDHLADDGNPVPRILPDLTGRRVQTLAGRATCLIQYLPGVSVSRPTPAQAGAAGAALAHLHASTARFSGGPDNALGLAGWRKLIDQLGTRADADWPGLSGEVEREWQFLRANWPSDLPMSVIHADFFCDNVLMTGDVVSGIIDFYFACREITAYDFAVTHGAWCFSADGTRHDPALAYALAQGYQSVRPLSPAERAAMPTLARGASLRFLLTRALDWIDTPADALVTRKDPIPYRNRLHQLQADDAMALFAL